MAGVLVVVHTGSVAVACRPSYLKACGILALQPGIESKSPALQGRQTLYRWTTRGVPPS